MTLPARRTQAERTELSDQAMFDATVHLIVNKGADETSLKEVGILAGFSRGLAGHRFGNKDRLFAFVIRRVGGLWLQQLKTATDGLVGIAAMEQALQQHYRFCVDAPDYLQAFYTLWFVSVNADSELNQAIKSIHQRRHQDVVEWIQNDASIDKRVKNKAAYIADQFSASVVGIVYSWLSNPNQGDDQIKSLHDGLKQTMQLLLTAPNRRTL